MRHSSLHKRLQRIAFIALMFCLCSTAAAQDTADAAADAPDAEASTASADNASTPKAEENSTANADKANTSAAEEASMAKADETSASSAGADTPAKTKQPVHSRIPGVRSKHSVQPFPQRPSARRDDPKVVTPKGRTLSRGDTDGAVQALEDFTAHFAELTLHSGERVRGTVDYFTHDAVLLITHTGSLHIIELKDIQAIDSAARPTDRTLTLQDEPRQKLQSKQELKIQERIRTQRLKEAHQYIGRPLRITGGTLLGLGAIAEVWGLTVLTTTARDAPDDGGPFGNSMAVPVAIIGAPLIISGISLIVGANIKRNRAVNDYKKRNDAYSVVPTYTRAVAG